MSGGNLDHFNIIAPLKEPFEVINCLEWFDADDCPWLPGASDQCLGIVFLYCEPGIQLARFPLCHVIIMCMYMYVHV